MKVSRPWLQKYFEKELPSAEELADALTFHAFEIESVAGDVLDVKVLPNRAADCLSHRGIAKELSAVLEMPMKKDPLASPVGINLNSLLYKSIDTVFVSTYDTTLCRRYVAGYMQGVEVGSSPQWLKELLTAVGQKSINNIVDATNYVMLDIGQPLHAFDAGKLVKANIPDAEDSYNILVRNARTGEKYIALDGKEYVLNESMLVIADDNADTVLGIAGVKGGMASGITEKTKNIIIESANFDGASIRRTAQALNLFTDASQRFQNRPSPELAAYGMRDALVLIQEVAGGELVGVTDLYDQPQFPIEAKKVVVTASRVNGLLGSQFSKEDIADVFRRLGLPTEVTGEAFTVTPPFERADLATSEDLVEEVGRILGYDKVPATLLPSAPSRPDQARFRGIEKVKDKLIEQGFTEISTQSFAKRGDVYLANPLDKKKPALRKTLAENMREAKERAEYYASLVLGPNQTPKFFEVGTVFLKEGERVSVETSESDDARLITDDDSYEPKRHTLGMFKPFSVYPFVLRDIALWVPPGTPDERAKSIIEKEAGNLLARIDLFDTFEKEGKKSFAFRLVFQSMERTLADDEVNQKMENITAVLIAHGFKVR